MSDRFDYIIKDIKVEWEKNPVPPEKRCFLCGGDHSQDKSLPKVLRCPYCETTQSFMVMPHCPGGVSHGETHFCLKCNHEVFIVSYYDGGATIQKPNYYCWECKRRFESRKEIEKTHTLDEHGSWHCKKVADNRA